MIAERNFTANVSQRADNFSLEYITHISNDGNDDIYVGFIPLDAPALSEEHFYFTIKPGEIIGNLHLRITKVYYKSESGAQPFRIGGLTKYVS